MNPDTTKALALCEEGIAGDQVPHGVPGGTFPNGITFVPVDGPLAKRAREFKERLGL